MPRLGSGQRVAIGSGHRVAIATVCLAILFALVTPGACLAAELNIFAAASLTEALQEIGKSWDEQHPDVHAVFNFAASSALALQIQEGAPADVFFSADEAKMDVLEKKSLLSPGTRHSLLSNTLVIVVPRDRRIEVKSGRDLQEPKFAHIALAEPQSVPAGIYAKEYLRQQGIWSKVIDKVIPTENVRAALAAVESGNVEAGIVYKTDASISKKVQVAYEVPAAEGPKITYPVAILKDSRQIETAKQFVELLRSEAGFEVFRKHGFRIDASAR